MTPALPDIHGLFDPARVVILPGSPSKSTVVTALADLATGDLSSHDRLAFLRSVFEREDVTTTAIGGGLAIPHARSQALDRCRLVVGILPAGVSWSPGDQRPVYVALLIAARESDPAEHLRVMASLAQRLRRPGLVEQLRTMTDHQAIIDLMR